MDGRYHIWVKSVSSISCRTKKKNPFKYARTICDIAKKPDRGINNARELCDLRELFNNHNGVLFINNFNEIDTDVDNDNEVLILTPDYEVENDLDQTIWINDTTFELRMILCTTDISETKWNGVVYSRHGGPNHQAWWYQKRNEKLAMHTIDGTINHIDFRKTQIAVCVKEINNDMDKLRNDYFVYMGGHKYISCRDYKLPLISSLKLDNKYTHCNLSCNTICGKKKCISRSELNCQVCICKACYDLYDENVLTYLDQPYNLTVEFNPEENDQAFNIVIPYYNDD